MKIVNCTRTEFVNAMLTLKAPHPALYPFLSVFAALGDSCNNAKNAINLAEAASPEYESSPHSAGYLETHLFGFYPAKFTLKINLPHADTFHETYFETNGAGHYEVRYCGDDLDHLFPHIAP